MIELDPGYLIMAAAVFIGGFVYGAIGVGFGYLVVPALAIVNPDLVPGVVLCLAVPLSTLVAIRERGSVDWPGLTWIISGRVIGTGIAVLLLFWLSGPHLQVLFGAAVIAAVVTTKLQAEIVITRFSQAGAGLASGVFGTTAGIGGPPVALLYQSRGGPELRSTAATSFVPGTLLSLLALRFVDRLSVEHLLVALLLAPAMLGGLWISRLMLHVEGAWLRNGVLLASAIGGIIAIVEGVDA